MTSSPVERHAEGAVDQAGDAVFEWRRGSPSLLVHRGGQTTTYPAAQDRALWGAGVLSDGRALADWQADHRECGPAAASRLLGPFAAVLWDAVRRNFVLVRDRAGTYGIHWMRRGDVLLLSPSLDSLLPDSGGMPVPDVTAAARHLHGIAPPPGSTFVDGIAAVEPATVVEVDVERIRATRYWTLEPTARLRLATDLDYAEALRALLDDIVPQYASPGRAGITLSGGLDSTTVAAILASRASTELEAVSWSAPDVPTADEADRSSLVAERLGIPMRRVRADRWLPWSSAVTAGRAAAWRPYGLFAELLDATFVQLARSGLEVAFTGVPGDPLFGNSINPAPDLLLTRQWRRMRTELEAQARIFGLSRATALRRRLIGPIAHTYVRTWARGRAATPDPIAWLADGLRAEWPDLARQPSPAPRQVLLPGRRDRFRDLVHPFQTHTLENLTRHAHSHGIDLRHPLSDHRLVEFAACLPTEQATYQGVDKHVVRLAMQPLLPSAIVDRPWKTVQTDLMHAGLRGPGRRSVVELATDMALAAAGVVDEARFRRVCDDYLAGRHDELAFCHTLALEEWIRERW